MGVGWLENESSISINCRRSLYGHTVSRFVALIPTGEASKWLFDLKVGPHLNSSQGMGKRARERKANRLPAQCTPSFWYIWIVNRGNVAPKE